MAFFLSNFHQSSRNSEELETMNFNDLANSLNFHHPADSKIIKLVCACRYTKPRINEARIISKSGTIARINQPRNAIYGTKVISMNRARVFMIIGVSLMIFLLLASFLFDFFHFNILRFKWKLQDLHRLSDFYFKIVFILTNFLILVGLVGNWGNKTMVNGNPVTAPTENEQMFCNISMNLATGA